MPTAGKCRCSRASRCHYRACFPVPVFHASFVSHCDCDPVGHLPPVTSTHHNSAAEHAVVGLAALTRPLNCLLLRHLCCCCCCGWRTLPQLGAATGSARRRCTCPSPVTGAGSPLLAAAGHTHTRWRCGGRHCSRGCAYHRGRGGSRAAGVGLQGRLLSWQAAVARLC
jgi:hypothetical protein